MAMHLVIQNKFLHSYISTYIFRLLIVCKSCFILKKKKQLTNKNGIHGKILLVE